MRARKIHQQKPIMKTTRSRSTDLRDNVRAVILGVTLGPLAGAVAWGCYVFVFAF